MVLMEFNAPRFDRAPSPPRFSAGEKVAEGRMRGRFSVAATFIGPPPGCNVQSSEHLRKDRVLILSNTPLYVGVAGLRIREVVREKPNSPPRSFELVDEKGSPPSSRTPWSIRGPQSGACVYKAGARGNRVGKRINFINLE